MLCWHTYFQVTDAHNYQVFYVTASAHLELLLQPGLSCWSRYQEGINIGMNMSLKDFCFFTENCFNQCIMNEDVLLLQKWKQAHKYQLCSDSPGHLLLSWRVWHGWHFFTACCCRAVLSKGVLCSESCSSPGIEHIYRWYWTTHKVYTVQWQIPTTCEMLHWHIHSCLTQ